jgi:long-chain acyl-CoA synthetase
LCVFWKETRPVRHPSAANGLLVTPEPQLQTLHDVGKWAAQKYRNNKCIGRRRLIKVHEVEQMVDKIVNGQKVQEKKKWLPF